MVLLALGIGIAAAAPTIDVIVADGPMRPGRTSHVVVAAVEGSTPYRVAPAVEVSGGLVDELVPVRPGVWRVQLEPRVDAEQLQITVRAGGRTHRSEHPVRVPDLPTLSVPPLIDGSVRDAVVSFVVSGDDIPPVDALEVVVGEGSIADLVAVEDGIRVDVTLEDQPFPRVVPIGVRDLRGDRLPVWSRIRLHARPRLPLQAEPGSTLSLLVSGRSYGPFEADDDGRIDASVDQYPGERVAQGLFRDDLGNETRTDIPLVSPAGVTLIAFAAGDALPGRVPPLVHLAAVVQDGSSVGEGLPTCRTPAIDLPVREVLPGAWYAALPILTEPQDVRVECSLAGATRVAKVRLTEGVASDLRLRVWPDEMRSDLPFAEVRAVLEDVQGERLSTEGVRVSAGLGEVTLEGGGGIVTRGEYSGAEAIEAGADQVRAVYDPPPGEGSVHELQLAWSAVPTGADTMEVYARVLDARRRPLPGEELEIEAGGSAARVKSGLDGWATARLRVEADGSPLRVGANTDWLRRQTLLLPGSPAWGGPGTPTLQHVLEVSINPSRVSGISVEVDPPVLRSGPGALAWVYVKLEDRSGRPILDEPVELEASEGTLGELHERSDGTLVATYEPDPADGSREVQITARTDSLRSSARLVLEPRAVRVSLGPWVGFQSNFGAVAGPVVGADVDLRTPLRVIGESVLFRAGISGYGFRSTAETGVGTDAELRSSVIPFTGAVLFRDDRGPWAFWGGGGGSLAVHRLEVRFGDDLVSAGSRILGGPNLVVGGSRRLLGGELLVTLRAVWLPARDVEVGYFGNVGGLTGGLGYRLVY